MDADAAAPVSTEYEEFIERKRLTAPDCGVDVPRDTLHAKLKPFQRDLTWWALRKGRAALFADTGLGKTFMQLEWAAHAADRSLILAPLAVTRQTVREGDIWGIPVTYSGDGAAHDGVTVTNYERLHLFDPANFGAVVLDESSILKNYAGKTRTAIIEAFADTPMRLACTATPAPNDIAEIANHAEFLGIVSRPGMLATFFVHDQAGWRLKRPAETDFYRWLASWGMFLRHPSDLGYDGAEYDLPPLDIAARFVDADYVPDGQLFATGLHGITDRSRVRRGTLASRVQAAADLILAEPDEPWIAWCGLNDESAALSRLLPDAVEVTGAQDPDLKADALLRFANGDVRVLVTKPTIAGFGLNFQHCARQVFVGLGDSYEQYYQSIRRCWRFGQARAVRVTIVLSELERDIIDNVRAKQAEAEHMARQVVSHVAEFELAELGGGMSQEDVYTTDETTGAGWTLWLGDSAERMAEIDGESVDLSVFSPPFLSLYQYSNSPRDLGNCQSPDVFWRHFDWVSRELLRITKPGRHVCVHVAQQATTAVSHGVIGLRDFRGMTIAHFEAQGFIFHGEITIDKDPQAQAIRTHSKALLFVQKNKDSSWLRPALADYIVVFRKPGENAVAVKCDLTNNEWIEWARPIWYGIRETDTLNAAEGRGKDDERHICPLQLGTIERVIRLWSNPGELVFTPFAGIGSEMYEAIRLNRRALGIELKRSYYDAAVNNLRRAERQVLGDLFAWANENAAANE